MSQAQVKTESEKHSRTLQFDDPRVLELLFGPERRNLKTLQRMLDLKIHARDTQIFVEGCSKERVDVGCEILAQLYEVAEGGVQLGPTDVSRSVRMLSGQTTARLRDVFLDSILLTERRGTIAPKSLAQKAYVDAIRKTDIVFGVGPAGTGKTYLAMAMALDAFQKREVQRIILTRPAVEAGEKLGFLPGDLAEKVNPYLRPLRDALNDMIDVDQTGRLLERGDIEVAPLAFMRGRTLNDSFVILDEAQNSTREQMKMFLTRLGFGTRAVITGDVTQIDLPSKTRSGLAHAITLLENIDGIEICYFSEEDVVRHPLVMEIIKAYDRDDRQQET
jgi:phosphate starvation-inducible PhoH-like protein